MGFARGMAPVAAGQLLDVKAATKTFPTPEGGRATALEGVDLAVRGNEFLTLLGPSGCGKTTLLRSIAGFEDLDAGEVRLEGRSLGGVPPHRRPFNTVFQSYALFPHLTVDDNVGYGPDVAGVPREERRARVAAALGLVGLTGLERRKSRQLSGGQQQRVALARAIVNRPRLLLLDEPLSALDRKLRLSMQVELKNLQHTLGISFLYVTHDQEEALAMSDRIAVMDRGRVLQLGTPTTVYHTPVNRFVAGFVGSGSILAGRVVRCDGAGAIVATEGGLELIVEARGFTPGAQVDVLLRPESLEISRGARDGARPLLDATIEQVVFVGSALEVRARLADGTAVTALHRDTRGGAASGLGPGQAVRLAYDPASAHAMPGEG